MLGVFLMFGASVPGRYLIGVLVLVAVLVVMRLMWSTSWVNAIAVLRNLKFERNEKVIH